MASVCRGELFDKYEDLDDSKLTVPLVAPFRPSKASILNRSGGNSVIAQRPSWSIFQNPSLESASWGNFRENPTTAIGSSMTDFCILVE